MWSRSSSVSVRVHPGRGLVEHDERRVGREGASHLQAAAVRVGQDERRLVLSVARQARPEEVEALLRALADPLLLAAHPRRPDHGAEDPRAPPAVLADHGVLEHRHVREQVDRLEGSRDAEPRDPVGREADHAVAPEPDVPVVGTVQPRGDVEHRALAGAVRSDHRDDLALVHVHVQARQRVQAAEVLGHARELEQMGGAVPHVGPIRSLDRLRTVRARVAHSGSSGSPPRAPPGTAVATAAAPPAPSLTHTSCVTSSASSSRLRRTFGMRPCGRKIMIATKAPP